MYLPKAWRNIEEQDARELSEKREKYERRQSDGSSEKVVREKKHFNPDELPDGASFQPPPKVFPSSGVQEEEEVSEREAEYIGSFSVVGEDQAARTEFVKRQLEAMRSITKHKPVLLLISLSGIKICTPDKQTVHMAHALKRISYATCDPDFNQFSFLAREPKAAASAQYCHTFITKEPEEAEELNTLVGNIFKMAYAHQKTKQPTFNEIIEQQIEEQKAQFREKQYQTQKQFERRLSDISTARVSELAQMKKALRQKSIEEEEQRKKEEAAGKNRVWAKHHATKVKHRDPFLGDPSSRKLSPPTKLVKHQNDKEPRMKSPPPLNGESLKNQNQALMANLIEDMNNSNGPRSYGSPVMTLKESIDRSFSSNNGNLLDMDLEDLPRHDLLTPPPVPKEQPENYLYPVSHRQNSTESQSSKTSNPAMIQRPLPATPLETHRQNSQPAEEQRSRSSWGSEGQRSRTSWSSDGQRSRESYASSTDSSSLSPSYAGEPFLNNTKTQTCSRYQNDSPFRYTVPPNGVYQCGAGPPSSRYDSIRHLQQQAHDGREDETLKMASWYQAGIPREIALEILSHEDIGSFIVRDSTTHAGCFALSVKVPKFDNPTGIAHYLIKRTPNGVRLKGLDKEWSNITSLVVHLTVMPEMLPCTLRFPNKSNNPTYIEEEEEEEEENEDEDPDYRRLADFTSMMADMKM